MNPYNAQDAVFTAEFNNLSFAVDGTEVLWNRHHYFLFFNSARAVNSMGTFLVILCALVAPSFY